MFLIMCQCGRCLWKFGNGHRYHGNSRNVQKFQIGPNFLKIDRHVKWHIKSWYSTLEFPKWPPFPWKQHKNQKFQNAPKLMKFYNNVDRHL